MIAIGRPAIIQHPFCSMARRPDPDPDINRKGLWVSSTI
jgi:hypothetical protein